MKTPQDIAIVGAGLMGHAIAYALASAGHRVRVFDRSTEALTALPERLAGIADLFGDPPHIADAAAEQAPKRIDRRAAPEFSICPLHVSSLQIQHDDTPAPLDGGGLL